MPVIACPGCGKKYNLPESAAGQVATCKCGKRFKVGAAKKAESALGVAVSKSSTSASPATAATPSKPVSKSKHAAVSKAAPAISASAVAADDDFWDEGLKTVTVAKEPEPPPPPASKPTAKSASTSKKKPKAEKRVRWGFDWGRVVAGGLSFLVFGGITAVLLFTTGRISIYLAFAAAAGLFTALSGLMGEEGIW